MNEEKGSQRRGGKPRNLETQGPPVHFWRLAGDYGKGPAMHPRIAGKGKKVFLISWGEPTGEGLKTLESAAWMGISIQKKGERGWGKKEK